MEALPGEESEQYERSERSCGQESQVTSVKIKGPSGEWERKQYMVDEKDCGQRGTARTLSREYSVFTIKGNYIWHPNTSPQRFQTLNQKQFVSLSELLNLAQGSACLDTNQSVTLNNNSGHKFNKSKSCKLPIKSITNISPFIHTNEVSNIKTFMEFCTRPTNVADANLNTNTTCVVCKKGLNSFGISCIINCQHYLHTRCLDEMFEKQTPLKRLTCPLCSSLHPVRAKKDNLGRQDAMVKNKE